MTTIVLVIIGILIAAVAALMVVWYGGDAFGRSGATAQAQQLINAGQNILSAHQLYMAHNGAEPDSYAHLTSTNDYLAERPAISDDLGTVDEDWISLTGDGSSFAVANVPDEVCRRVNQSLRGDNDIPDTVTQVMGCMTRDGTNLFYVRLQGRG